MTDFSHCESPRRYTFAADGRYLYTLPPDLPIRLELYRFDPHYPSFPNYHDHFEITYFLQGQAIYTIGGRPYPCREGDVFVVRGGVFHVVDDLPPPRVEVLALYFAPEVVHALGSSEIYLEYMRVFLSDPAAGCARLPLDPVSRRKLLDGLSRIAEEQRDQPDFHRIAVRNALCDILLLLNRAAGPSAPSAETPLVSLRNAQRLRPVFELIRHRFAEHLRLQELARAAAMTPSSFSRYFRRITGLTVTEYITRFRVDRAKELLLSTDRAITWIAFEVGFESHSYFDRVFRRIARLTPQDFRRQHTPVVPADASPA